jgi:hypothetical protein
MSIELDGTAPEKSNDHDKRRSGGIEAIIIGGANTFFEEQTRNPATDSRQSGRQMGTRTLAGGIVDNLLITCHRDTIGGQADSPWRQQKGGAGLFSTSRETRQALYAAVSALQTACYAYSIAAAKWARGVLKPFTCMPGGKSARSLL